MAWFWVVLVLDWCWMMENLENLISLVPDVLPRGSFLSEMLADELDCKCCSGSSSLPRSSLPSGTSGDVSGVPRQHDHVEEH